LKSLALVSVAIVLLLLAGVLYYIDTSFNKNRESAQEISSTSSNSKYITSACDGDQGTLENVNMDIEYEIIEDSMSVSAAREFIKDHLPVPASLGREPQVDWLNTNISILKIIIKISNNNGILVYYETNTFCGTSYWNNDNSEDTIFDWKVNNPIAIPKIIAYNGSVFPISIVCTLDFGYADVPPKSVVVNEFYFITTKPFKGEVKAMSTVCLKPFCNICKPFERNIYIIINDNK